MKIDRRCWWWKCHTVFTTFGGTLRLRKNMNVIRFTFRITYVFRIGGLQGKVIVNDKLRILEEFRRISCYIQQDDRIQPLLTVYENMSIAADLKLGPKVTNKQKNTLVRTIITNLVASEFQILFSKGFFQQIIILNNKIMKGWDPFSYAKFILLVLNNGSQMSIFLNVKNC